MNLFKIISDILNIDRSTFDNTNGVFNDMNRRWHVIVGSQLTT